MKGLAGLKRGLGYFTARPRTPQPDVSGITDADAAAWKDRFSEAARGMILSEHLADASVEVGGADSAVTTALNRMRRDQEAHVNLASGVLDAIGADPPTVDAPRVPQGDELERSARLVLSALCVGMSAKCDASSVARNAATGAEQAALDLLTRDQIAHADLGFLLWPMVRHTWESRLDSDPDEFAKVVVQEALTKVSEPVRARLLRRFKGIGLDLAA